MSKYYCWIHGEHKSDPRKCGYSSNSSSISLSFSPSSSNVFSRLEEEKAMNHLQKVKPSNPNNIVKLFSMLINLLPDDEAEKIKKVQKKYADDHGVTLYQ
jgi:hypothetical protein